MKLTIIIGLGAIGSALLVPLATLLFAHHYFVVGLTRQGQIVLSTITLIGLGALATSGWMLIRRR